MAKDASPEVQAAIKKGALIEVIALFIGGVFAYITGNIAFVIVGAVVGTAAMLFMMAQAGLFAGRNDGR